MDFWVLLPIALVVKCRLQGSLVSCISSWSGRSVVCLPPIPERRCRGPVLASFTCLSFLETESPCCVDQGGWLQIHRDPPGLPDSLVSALKACNTISGSFSLNCKNNLEKRNDSIWFNLY